ncbi:MAG: serine hydrolase domain-containing protein [Microthrixaceae bacterium]
MRPPLTTPRPLLVALASMLSLALASGACSKPSTEASGDDVREPAEAEPAAEVETTRPTETTAPAEPIQDVFPGTEWERWTPQAAGLDPGVLDEVAASAEQGRSDCLVVTRDGRLVAEWYWNGTTPQTSREIFSASKSFTSVLVGIASDDGDLSVDQPASTWIPQWVGTPSEDVTVEALLNNTSGRYHDLATDYGKMAVQAVDKTGFAIGLSQQSEPGTTWAYNNSAIQTLEEVVTQATGTDMAEFGTERLFEPLGMADSSWNRDRAGNPLAFIGVQSTCRDLARFGLMALNQGEWDGEQVVSADWMQRSTGESSQELNAAYGWLWWLNRVGPVLSPETASGGAVTPADSQMVAGAPEDMFFALGLGGQIVAVDPGSRTVVTRLGPSIYPPGTDKFTTDDAARVVTEAVMGDATG